MRPTPLPLSQTAAHSRISHEQVRVKPSISQSSNFVSVPLGGATAECQMSKRDPFGVSRLVSQGGASHVGPISLNFGMGARLGLEKLHGQCKIHYNDNNYRK